MLIESFSEIKKKKDMYPKGKIINDVLIKSKQNSLDCVFLLQLYTPSSHN